MEYEELQNKAIVYAAQATQKEKSMIYAILTLAETIRLSGVNKK